MPISSFDLKPFLYNRFFVETGSAALGWGISSALKAGFEKVYSVEINPESYKQCSNIFKNDARVSLTFGDCGQWLEDILNELNEPCTIYLDANGWRDEIENPFDISIEAIIRHGRKDHTILCDDMNHDKEEFDVVEKYYLSNSSHIGNQIRRINDKYKMYIIDTHTEDMSHTFLAWVGVAQPLKE